MIKEVKRYIKRNPYHAGLIAYNLGCLRGYKPTLLP